MHGSYYRLVVFITLKHPLAAQDIVLRTSRVIPFPPTEGMTLVFRNDDDEEYELTLGPPRYEFAESAFIEYQEDETLLDANREGTFHHNSVGLTVDYYGTFGFEQQKPKQVISLSTVA